MLKGKDPMKKHVLIGVTGGIAAYKALDIVSQLRKSNLEVRVMMTEHASQFVSPLSFSTLSKNRCEVDLFDPHAPDPIAHINLAAWADLVILVPCTANVLAKVVHGISDDLLTSTFLACHCDKMIAPAMNTHMYENPVTQQNLQKAKDLNIQIIEPETGHLACDVEGKGKLAAVETIVETIRNYFLDESLLEGKRVLISAGPTQESLDPVRYITNHSSGKQGYAIAKAAKRMGAEVTLVSGPVHLPIPEGVKPVFVTSAQEMFTAMKEESVQADYIIMAAAVADYRPAVAAQDKIKKTGEDLVLKMVRNPDILAWIGQHKAPNQIVCGFAMETRDLDQNAREKMIKKNCDLLIANNLKTPGAGFQTDTNVVTIMTQDHLEHLPKIAKEDLGVLILKTMKEIEKER